jgi:hypothetical protein
MFQWWEFFSFAVVGGAGIPGACSVVRRRNLKSGDQQESFPVEIHKSDSAVSISVQQRLRGRETPHGGAKVFSLISSRIRRFNCAFHKIRGPNFLTFATNAVY